MCLCMYTVPEEHMRCAIMKPTCMPWDGMERGSGCVCLLTAAEIRWCGD